MKRLGRDRGIGRGRSAGTRPVALRAGLAAGTMLASAAAHAQDMFIPTARAIADPGDMVLASLFAGTVLGGGLFIYRLMQERSQLSGEAAALRARVATLSRNGDRLAALADARDRRIVLWPEEDGLDARPVLFGELPADTGAPPDRATFLGFGRWLQPHSAGLLEHAITELREAGQPFDLTLETNEGAPLEVEGRTSTSGQFIRFQPTHASRRTETDLRVRAQRLRARLDRIEALTGEIEHPTWTRDAEGRLDNVNLAYARLRGLASPVQVVSEQSELFGEIARGTIADELDGPGARYAGRLSTTVEGERRVFAVDEVRTESGTAGVAVDVTEADSAQATLERTRRAHAEALDNLATAVASFNANAKLVHWNAAFQRMWDIDPAFLESAPSNTALLDRLRADGKLGETPDWRAWVAEMLEIYHANEPREFEWLPPDGRTLHVVAAPQEGGGVTWLFENMTEQHALASRATEIQRVRDASLERLQEGIAVFGPDGRLRLANPAFAGLWNLEARTCERGTHVSAIAAACADEFETPSTLWAEIVEDVTAFNDARDARTGQVRLAGDRTLTWTSVPLPNGQTMLTFVDVSDTVRVADALQARNEAMEWADRHKSSFVSHVSHQFRSPLMTIIGYTNLLQSGGAGPVSPRHAEYLDHIDVSSQTLRSLVERIIDLAAIDAGELELKVAPTDVAGVIAKAVESVRARVEDHDFTLEVVSDDRALGSIEADGARLAAILQNLLDNAIDWTPDDGTIVLAVERDDRAGELVLAVKDEGPGFDASIKEKAFDAFVQHSGENGHRGAGLGLSVVEAFVKLHGGSVGIDSRPGRTVVTTRIPLSQRSSPTASTPKGTPRQRVLRAAPVADSIPAEKGSLRSIGQLREARGKDA